MDCYPWELHKIRHKIGVIITAATKLTFNCNDSGFCFDNTLFTIRIISSTSEII